MLSAKECRDLCRLIGRAIVGDGTPADGNRLNAWLLASPEARQFYYYAMALQSELSWGQGKQQMIDELLDAELAAHARDRALAPGHGVRGLRIALSPKWLALAASLLLAGYFVGMAVFVSLRGEAEGWRLEARRGQEAGGIRREAEGDDSESSSLKSQASSLSLVASITATRDAEWSAAAHKSAISNQHSAITPGEPLELASGLVELKLTQGATLFVEGPAEWSIDGDNRATLTRGKLLARVPRQAIGFTLETPTARIVDLGTEFGVEVNTQDAAEVHVLKGLVTVQTAPENGTSVPSRNLKAGQSLRIDADGTQSAGDPATGEKLTRLAEGNANAPSSGPGYEVVFHYHLGEDDPHAQFGEVAAEQAIGTGTLGSAHPLARVGKPRYASETPNADSKLALSLPGNAEVAGYVGKDFKNFPTDNFVLEAWVRTRSAKPQLIVCLGDPSYNGYGLVVANGKYSRLFGGVAVLSEREEIRLNAWTHLALIREGHVSQLFVNGVASGEEVRTEPRPPDQMLRIGGLVGSQQTVDGCLDEIRLIRLKSYFHSRMLLFEVTERNERH